MSQDTTWFTITRDHYPQWKNKVWHNDRDHGSPCHKTDQALWSPCMRVCESTILSLWPVSPVVIVCPASGVDIGWSLTPGLTTGADNLTIQWWCPARLLAPPCCLHINETVAKMLYIVVYCLSFLLNLGLVKWRVASNLSNLLHRYKGISHYDYVMRGWKKSDCNTNVIKLVGLVTYVLRFYWDDHKTWLIKLNKH